MLALRIGELPAIFPLHVMVFPRTVGLFLLGAALWRSGILRSVPAHRSLLFAAAIVGILLGGGLELAAAGQELFDGSSLGAARFPAERLGAIVLALGYAALVVAAVSFPAGRRLLGWAAPLGRMAFTNYLGAIGDLRLDLLRLWPRPIRPTGRRRDPGDRRLHLRSPGRLQRLVVAPLPLRSRRVVLALVHVRRGAADAARLGVPRDCLSRDGRRPHSIRRVRLPTLPMCPDRRRRCRQTATRPSPCRSRPECVGQSWACRHRLPATSSTAPSIPGIAHRRRRCRRLRVREHYFLSRRRSDLVPDALSGPTLVGLAEQLPSDARAFRRPRPRN